MTADRKAYNRAYYESHPEKYKRTPEQNARRNELRRKKYAESSEMRTKIYEQVKKSRNRQPLQRYAAQYGISAEEIELMMNRGCSVCHANPMIDPTVRLHIDHNHTTGTVRGVLCQSCNIALGQLKEDPIRIGNLLNYLMRAETSGSSGLA